MISFLLFNVLKGNFREYLKKGLFGGKREGGGGVEALEIKPQLFSHSSLI